MANSRYSHPHLKIELVLPIEDGTLSKRQVIKIQDLKDALEMITGHKVIEKGNNDAP